MSFLIDDVDKDILTKKKWKLQKTGYVTSYENGKTFYMHREIMGAVKGQEIDHINRNKSDNRRLNLRFATRELQLLNRGASGAYYDKSVGGYKAYLKKKYLGLFKDKKSAMDKYNEVKAKYISEKFQ